LNNIQVTENCFVAIASLLSWSCETGTTPWASFHSPCQCSLPTISAILMMCY